MEIENIGRERDTSFAEPNPRSERLDKLSPPGKYRSGERDFRRASRSHWEIYFLVSCALACALSAVT